MIQKISQGNPDQDNIFLRHGDTMCLVAILLIVAALRFPFLEIPLERDEGGYAYMAQLILRGIPPYKEAYMLHFPGIFITYALIFSVFGQSIFAIHFGLLIANLLTIVFIFLIGKKLFNAWIGIISGATLGLLGFAPNIQGLFAHVEPFTMLFICAGVYLLLLGMDSRKRLFFFWSGFLFSLGILFKQSGLIFIGFPIVCMGIAWAKATQDNRNVWIANFSSFIRGAFIPFIILALIFLATGSWSEMIFWTFLMPKEIAHDVSTANLGSHLMHQFPLIFQSFPLLWGVAAIGLLTPLWNKKSPPSVIFVILLWIFSFITMSIGFYLRPHYFLYLLPATALLAGTGFYSINGLIKKIPIIKNNNLIITGLALTLFSYSIFDQREFLFQTDLRTVSRMIYGGNPLPESIEIADYVIKHSSPEDRIAIIGSEPQILFYSKRMSATKHIYSYFMMGNHPHALAMQEETIRAIESAKPPIIIHVAIPSSWLVTNNPSSRLFVWLKRFVSKYYKLAGVVEIKDENTTNYYWGENIKKITPGINESYLIVIFQRLSD